MVVFFEAPHRVLKTLAELETYVNRPIIIGRELTKFHEEFVKGTPGELQKHFAAPQGEFTLMIPPEGPDDRLPKEVTDEAVMELFGQITERGASSTKRETAREVGERLGLTAKQVYEIVERNKLVE